MTPLDIFLILLLGLITVGFIFVVSMSKEFAGGYRLLLWLNRQLGSFTERGSTTTSEQEKQAIQETLRICEKLKKVSLEKWNFKTENFSLVEKIAFIYHPNATAPIEQARLGDVLEAVQEANQKVLNIIHLPQINAVTQFRIIQVFEIFSASSQKKIKSRQEKSGVMSLLLRPISRRLQTIVVKTLLIQWMLMVGEAALKVYSGTPQVEEVKDEEILAEWNRLQDEPDSPLPENVKQIADSSKKEILFSVASISWKKVGQIYYALTDQIARHYHSDSAFPIYEARVCDLLKSVSDFLEGVGRLGQKPVLNKILMVRISQLTQAKDIALPFGKNKIMDWVNKYQVGRVAKWSHTLYRTLQKKQPGILLRDVVFGVVKEGGKRWLVLYLHGKIAAEANKLYKTTNVE